MIGEVWDEEKELRTCALPGIPGTQTDGKKSGDQNRVGSFSLLVWEFKSWCCACNFCETLPLGFVKTQHSSALWAL